MLNGRTFYQILGVQPDAEDVVIKAAYRALSQRYHPDKWAGDPKVGSDRMTELNRAYAVLSDSDQRRVYDKELKAKGCDSEYPESEPAEELFKEEVSEQDLDWQYAAQFFPEIDQHLDDLKKINYGLAFTYKSILLSKKSFKEATLIKQKLKKSFLERYFGSNQIYLDFAEKLIDQRNRSPLLELNKAIRILGDSVRPDEVIQRIRLKYHLDQFTVTPELLEKIRRLRKGGGPPLAIEILSELGYMVIEHKSSGFLGASKYQLFNPDGKKLVESLGGWDLYALTRDKIVTKYVGEF